MTRADGGAQFRRTTSPSGVLGSPTSGDPRAPYRILVIIQLAAALFALAFGAVPDHDLSVAGLDVVLALAMIVWSAVVWFLLPRMASDLGIDVAIVVDTVIAGYCVAVITLVESAFLVALGLVAFGVFAAYYRSRRRLVAHLVVMSVAYGVGLIINPMLPEALDYVVVVAMIWGISLMVATLVEQLREDAMRDPLTGLLNRRALDLVGGPLEAAAARAGTPVTVGMIDLDDFKAYNDTFGHLAGDRLLADVAAAWGDRLRTSDLLVRFGGDEFAVVLAGTTVSDAENLAEEVRRTHPALWTVGFSPWRHDESLDEALGRADTLLLARKHRRET